MQNLVRVTESVLPDVIEKLVRDSSGVEVELLSLSPGPKILDFVTFEIPGIRCYVAHGIEGLKVREEALPGIENVCFMRSPHGNVRILGQPAFSHLCCGYYMGAEELEVSMPGGEELLISVSIDQSVAKERGWNLHHIGRVMPMDVETFDKLYYLIVSGACEYMFDPGQGASKTPRFEKEFYQMLEQLIQPWLKTEVEPLKLSRSEQNYDRIYKLATKLMGEWDPKQPLSMDDLAGKVYTSRRTLFQAFKYWVGMGPNQYYQLYRLRALRRRLLAAKPSSTTVTEQAQELGFTHVGRMIGLYREQFAETPRQSLNGYG